MARFAEIREVIAGMQDTAKFYENLFEMSHDPTCWRIHTACALGRVLDLIDGEEDA